LPHRKKVRPPPARRSRHRNRRPNRRHPPHTTIVIPSAARDLLFAIRRARCPPKNRRRRRSQLFARFRPQQTVCRRSSSSEGAAEVSPARKGRETKMPSFHSFRAVFSREPFAGTITIFPSPRFSSGPASAVPKRKCLRPFPLARFSRASLRHVQAPRVRHPPLASESCPLASTAPP
jgi:hypothetical protein